MDLENKKYRLRSDGKTSNNGDASTHGCQIRIRYENDRFYQLLYKHIPSCELMWNLN